MVPGIIGEGEETTKFFFGFARIAHYLDKEQPFYTSKPSEISRPKVLTFSEASASGES
jgi:hypothetical protein